MQHFLSIDWDFITGDCTLDVPNCCGFCKLNALTGPKRGAAKYLDRDWKDRLRATEKLRVAPGSPVVVAECHASVLEALKRHMAGQVTILDLDHHYDREHVETWDANTQRHLGEEHMPFPLHCANWIWYAEQEGHIVQSEIKPERVPKMTRCFQGVFLCLSSPWTPGLMDNHFFKLVSHFAKRSGIQPVFIGHKRNVLKKRYFRFLNVGKTSARVQIKRIEEKKGHDFENCLAALGGTCTRSRLHGRTAGFARTDRRTHHARR